MGAKERMAMAVPPRSGHMFCLTASQAAFTLFMPFCAATRTASLTTMELSTSIPSAMMNAPSEMRSIKTPICFMTAMVAITVRRRTPPMMRPDLRPMKKSSTAMTMTTASTRLTMKLEMASSTVSAWLETTPTSMPIGVVDSSSFMRFSRAFAMTITFPPATVETPRAMQGWPLWRRMAEGGSS